MNYFIDYSPRTCKLLDQLPHNGAWFAHYIDRRTNRWEMAGGYLTADAAFIVARWQAAH